MITDRTRFTVLEVNTDKILTRDLVVTEPQMSRNLSAPSNVVFKLKQGEQYASSAGIDWKKWGQWIIPETEVDYVRWPWGAMLPQEVTIDPGSGDLMIEALGFMGYPKGIPWLENFNPIAVDPGEVIQRLWAHLQNYPNSNLGVEVFPALTGTQMLPGYAFDGSVLNFDFFAMFIRAVDFTDCGDQITSLARDLPLDLFERVSWNPARTVVSKKMEIAYPLGGFHQDYLTFRMGENVIAAEPADESENDPVTDVIIRSWAPGRVMTSMLGNNDMTRARRTALEEDVNIDSTERAAAWAKRKLQKRNVPKSFKKITIDPNHPNAPFGKFDVGDTIRVQAPNFPWLGDVDEWHRIISMTYVDGAPTMDLTLKVEGAFNYDPIDYNPDWEEEPKEDPNRLANGYFRTNLSGWTSLQGQWFRVADSGYDIANLGYPNIGSVRVDLDDNGARFLSHRVHVTPGEFLRIEGAVRWQEVTSGPTDKFLIKGFTYLDGGSVSSVDFDDYVNPTGVHGWEVLRTPSWQVPEGINELAVQLTATAGVGGGISFWSGIRIVPA